MNGVDRPRVSVIIPALNEEAGLPALIASLKAQDYPEDRLELLIVDNGSTDHTAEIIKAAGLPALSEPRRGNSYLCRNRGLARATGDVIAFIDADCRADRAWLREGVRGLIDNHADMAAGKLVWELSENSLSARYSKFMFGRQQDYVRDDGSAATGNLFIRRRVFDEMGPFDDRLRFGADTLFTSRASQQGFKMIFCPEALVYHPAHHRLRSLYRRFWRAGFGMAQKTWGYGIEEYAFNRLRWYLPGRRQLMEFLGSGNFPTTDKVKVFFLVWLCKLAYVRGNREGYRYCRTVPGPER